MIYLEPTPTRTSAQVWDRIARVFSDYLNSLEYLTDEQRGDIFTKTMSYKEALEMVARMVGDDVESMEVHEGIADKVGDKFIEYIESTVSVKPRR